MLKRISAQELLALRRPFVPVDATWYTPGLGKDGHSEYLQERIPGAVFFDVDGVKSESPYPHMMPSAAQFATAMGKLGLSRSDPLVVYDKQSFLSAPRALWVLKTFGHPEALLLDNWSEYKRLGGAIETGTPTAAQRPPTTYPVPSEHGSWVEYDELHKLATSGKLKAYDVIDARSQPRFTGASPEPRPGLSSGHIPGSVSLPFSEVLKDGHFLPTADVKKLLESRGVTGDKPLILLCGSGVTACVLKVAVDDALSSNAEIYDGSWSEWAARAEPELIEKSQ